MSVHGLDKVKLHCSRTDRKNWFFGNPGLNWWTNSWLREQGRTREKIFRRKIEETPISLFKCAAETSCIQRDSIHQVFSSAVHTLCNYRRLRVFLLRSSQVNCTESYEAFYVEAQKSPGRFIRNRKIQYSTQVSLQWFLRIILKITHRFDQKNGIKKHSAYLNLRSWNLIYDGFYRWK